MQRRVKFLAMLLIVFAMMILIPGSVMAESEPPPTMEELTAAQLAKSPNNQDIIKSITTQGVARLILEVRTAPDFVGVAGLNSSAELAELTKIDIAQAGFSEEFPALTADMVTFEYTPYVSVWVTTEAEYAQLLASPSVVLAVEDVPVPAAGNFTVPPTMSEANSWIDTAVPHGFGYDGSSYAVAVLDTGVDKDHFYLDGGKVVSEACFTTSDSSTSDISYNICPGATSSTVGIEDPGSAEPYSGSGGPYNICPDDECEHGTHVAGIATGTHSGFSGVAPDANVIAIQIFSRFNSSNYCASANHADDCTLTWSTDQMSALDHVYALRSTYNIAAVNMSLGGGRYGTHCDTDPRKSYIDLLSSANIATVIAAGNDWLHDGVGAPGCISTAYTIGATYDNSDLVPDFSNADADILDMWAPGANITSSVTTEMNGAGSPTATWDGTSMATPVIAGAFAVMREAYPTKTLAEIWTILSNAGVTVTDTRSALYYSNPPYNLYTPAGDTVAPRIDFTNAFMPVTTPKLSSPTDDSSIWDSTPTFNWTLVSNATGYVIEYSQNSDFSGATVQATVSSTYTPSAPLAAGDWYWRVYGTNGGNVSAYSTEWMLTVNVLDAPTLSSPTSGTATYDATPTFDWGDVTNATGYVLDYSEHPDYSNSTPVVLTASTYTPPSPWMPGIWYWRVRATNSHTISAYSAGWNVTINELAQPSLVSPSEGEVVFDTTPTFDWDDVPDATGYTLEYSPLPDFTGMTAVSVTSSTHTPTTELALGDWYWRVRATNSEATSIDSLEWPFTVAEVTGPVLIGPPDGTSTTDHTPNFDWEDYPGATSYIIQVSPRDDFSILPINHTVTNSFFAPGISMINQQYWWRVTANMGGSLSDWSEVRTITITGAPGNAAPVAVSPADGATTSDRTPTFDWSDVPTAVRYRIQMSTTPGFGVWLVNQTTTVSTWTPGVNFNPGTYYWRVQAEGGGDSSWFTVKREITIVP